LKKRTKKLFSVSGSTALSRFGLVPRGMGKGFLLPFCKKEDLPSSSNFHTNILPAAVEEL
jgi:hypothetical protein